MIEVYIDGAPEGPGFPFDAPSIYTSKKHISRGSSYHLEVSHFD
ncbi:hypothetical protein ACT453_41605 [Bacillus sp. D-CC]